MLNNALKASGIAALLAVAALALQLSIETVQRRALMEQMSATLQAQSAMGFETQASVQAAAREARTMLVAVNEVLAIVAECEGNPDCFQNRYVGMIRALEQGSASGARTLEQSEQATENPSWLMRRFGFGGKKK